MRFKDKVAVVTGAASGAGKAYAEALAGEGATVMVADLDGDKGEAVAQGIRDAGGEAMSAQVDVSSDDSIQTLGRTVVETYGGVDYVVNAATVFMSTETPSLLDVSWDYYLKFVATNMHGPLLVVRGLYLSMIERGGGAIVNQSSTHAWMNQGYFSLAKLGLNGVTQSLARELGRYNIRVNAIALGPVDDPEVAETHPKVQPKDVAKIPLQRSALIGELASACLFLLSDEASFVTGHIFNVDGGQFMRP